MNTPKPPTVTQINEACDAGLLVFYGNRQGIVGAVAHRAGEVTIKNRIWIQRLSDKAWEYMDAAAITITAEKRKDHKMAAGKRAGGRPTHIRSTSKKGPRSNNGNLELIPVNDRRIKEIEEAQENLELVSERSNKAISKAHTNIDEAKATLLNAMHTNGFTADKNAVYSRPPWGNVVLQKKGEVKEEAKFTPGTAKPKKKKTEGGEPEEESSEE